MPKDSHESEVVGCFLGDETGSDGNQRVANDCMWEDVTKETRLESSLEDKKRTQFISKISHLIAKTLTVCHRFLVEFPE